MGTEPGEKNTTMSVKQKNLDWLKSFGKYGDTIDDLLHDVLTIATTCLKEHQRESHG
jgi:hypothetical protein